MFITPFLLIHNCKFLIYIEKKYSYLCISNQQYQVLNCYFI